MLLLLLLLFARFCSKVQNIKFEYPIYSYAYPPLAVRLFPKFRAGETAGKREYQQRPSVIGHSAKLQSCLDDLENKLVLSVGGEHGHQPIGQERGAKASGIRQSGPRVDQGVRELLGQHFAKRL